ncbi:hypothetical protein PUN28_015165 [Cardiocondyla obscurior]|uniref:Uncharacterized protein n=1 Tax=Cardiocondyla obscurior TaxID=286306 RepID=A0AAW2EZM9_9HYME
MPASIRPPLSPILVVTASTSEFVSETRTRRALDTGALPRGERGGLLCEYSSSPWSSSSLKLPPGSVRTKLRFYPRCHQILTDYDSKAATAADPFRDSPYWYRRSARLCITSNRGSGKTATVERE